MVPTPYGAANTPLVDTSVMEERRYMLRYILEQNAKRGTIIELPVGTDSLDEAGWLLDALDPQKLVSALESSSRIDLTSVCGAENARPVVRRMSVASTVSEREMMASLSLHGSESLGGIGIPGSMEAGTPGVTVPIPRLGISHASSTLDEQSLADIAFEFFLACCGGSASAELVQSVRGQLEISERRGKDLANVLEKAGVTGVAAGVETGGRSPRKQKPAPALMLDVNTHLTLLRQASPSDFQNFRAYMMWRNGTSVLVQDSLVQAVTTSWDASNAGPADDPDRTAHYLLAKMKGAFRRLECKDADDYDGKEKDETVAAIVAVCDEIASRCRSGSTRAIPFELRVSIAEVLLRGTFDSFDAGAVIDEADELDRLLSAKVWPVLGIDDDIHMALQIWAHYRNFYISKEVGLLERAIDIVSRRSQAEAPDARAVTAGNAASAKLVKNIVAGVRGECVRVLSDYHHLCGSPREVSSIIRLLVAVDTVSGDGEALADTLADLIRASVTESFDRKASEVRRHAPSEQDVVALLATACLELLRSECEEYSQMLRHYVPASPGLAAWALHEAYGARLLPWIISIRTLDKHSIATLGTALSLEDKLMSEMQAFGLDADVAPWGVLGRVTPQLYEWTKGQLNTLEQWSERIVSSEAWTSSTSAGTGADVDCGTSMGEMLKASNDVVESLFTMGIPIPPGVVRSMVDGVDAILQRYCDSVIDPLRGVDEIFPPEPPLTRYKKDVVDTAQQIDRAHTPGGMNQRPTSMEKSPGGSLKNITAKVGSVFTSSWLPALTSDQRERILGVTYESLSLRANSLRGVAQGMSQMQDVVIEMWEAGQGPAGGSDVEWASGIFSGVVDKAIANIEAVLHFAAVKLICGHLREDVFSVLYRFNVQAHRLNPVLLEVDACLGQMCQTLAPELTSQLAHHFCATLNAAVRHVLLDGGPVRWFSLSDVADLKDDMESMAYMFYADGDGLAQEEIEAIMRGTLEAVQLMDDDTGALVALLRDKSTMARRGLSENLVIRVLCHRKDHSASKFLKSQYAIKKTLPNVISASVSGGKGAGRKSKLAG